MENFINDHIERINLRISDFKTTTPDVLQIKSYLRDKYTRILPDIKDDLIEAFKNKEYKKSKIIDIANYYKLYINDIENFFATYLYHKLLNDISEGELTNNMLQFIKTKINDDKAYRFIKNDLSKINRKLMFLLKMKGYTTNILGINEGVMVANAGDSAQFLFLSRAILAGFNCSNVDVRSSRYDTIIDYNGTLLKIQVKGIFDNKIHFKDRDRGGQGIDHTHPTNIGRIITSADCDIYAAVDKQFGICYLIPMSYVDTLLPEQKIKALDIEDFNDFRENWNVIIDVVNRIQG
jgi:hypothetical protein